jgi:hypothetical protein
MSIAGTCSFASIRASAEFGILGLVFVLEREPAFAQLPAALADSIAEMLAHPVGDQELGILGPAVAGEPDLLGAERLAVGRTRVLLVRSAVADVALDDDHRRHIVDAAEFLDRLLTDAPLPATSCLGAFWTPAS